MIDIQTAGFLSTMYYLKPLSHALFGEFSQCDDTNLCDRSEAVIIPSRQILMRDFGSVENQEFHGIESGQRTTLAMIGELEGRDLLEYYAQTPYFLNEGFSMGETFQYAINLSTMLQRGSACGHVVRLHQTEEGHVTHEFDQRPPAITKTPGAVLY